MSIALGLAMILVMNGCHYFIKKVTYMDKLRANVVDSFTIAGVALTW